LANHGEQLVFARAPGRKALRRASIDI